MTISDFSEFAARQPKEEPAFENEDESLPGPEDLPVPLFFRVLIMPVKPKMVTRGGILLPDTSYDAQEIFNPYGRLVAIGEAAFTSRKLGDNRPPDIFPKIGDWVTFGRNAGAKIHYAGRKFIEINDDEILNILPDIEKVRRSV